MAAVAVNGPILDSERFIELAESPLPSPRISRTMSDGNKAAPPPLRPRRSSQRGLSTFAPVTLQEKLEEYDLMNGSRSRNHSIIDLYATDGQDDGIETFYSPLSSPAMVGTIHQTPPSPPQAPHAPLSAKHRNRISDIPVLPASGKEAGVKRAFRSKVGTDGSISLSILPSAAALSEMLESHNTTSSLPLGTYKPASAFAKSTASLGAPGSIDINRKSSLPTDYRRGSAALTGSADTRPLTIKRKKPAIFNPEGDALPISRAASIDVTTPTVENPQSPFSSSSAAQGAVQNSSPKRGNDLQLPVTQTFMTPLKRIPQSDISPPTTPPTWTGSTRSDTFTEEDSLPVSPRSSADRHSGERGIASPVKGRKLQYGQTDEGDDDADQSDSAVPPIPRRPTGEHVDLDLMMPFVCNIEDMKDKPGMLRRDSDDSTDMENDEDEDDDDGSDHDFGLDSFPVPSVIINSAKNTPRMYPLSPTLGDGRLTSSPAQRKASIASVNSRLRPKTDLYPIPTDANGNQEWDQATELEVRDRVFRAEIKKPNKADKARRKALQKVFDQMKRPTKLELYEASLLSVRDENGHKVRFGTLFEEKKTVVCFIRHFWCAQCQNYVDAIAKVRPEVLAKHNMNLVIISNGSWKMIKSYRKLLGNKCPYPIYTDRAKHIYTALGMTLRSWDAGKGPEEVGQYIQNSLGASVIAGIKSGVKLPLKPPGDQQQLGGEFVLGPGLNVHFCHRMKTTRGHAEIEDVLASAGVDLEEENRALGLESGTATPTKTAAASAKKKESYKRNSAMTYSTNGISSVQSSPSLASSIMNRLNSTRQQQHSIPASPKQPDTPTMTTAPKSPLVNGNVSNTSTISPPGSPQSAPSYYMNGGVGSPSSPTKTRSRRLVKKNRKSTQDLYHASQSQTHQSPLGISHAAPNGNVGGDASSNARPVASAAWPEAKPAMMYHSPLFRDGAASTSVVVEEHEAEAEVDNGDEATPSMASEFKHASAPPVIPTPTTVTPLSMGSILSPNAKEPRQADTAAAGDDADAVDGDGDARGDGYLCVNGESLESGEMRPTSSRFSESSEDEETAISSGKMKKNHNANAGSKRTSGSSTATAGNRLSRPRSFVRSLTLRRSNSSLSLKSASATRAGGSLLRHDSRQSMRE